MTGWIIKNQANKKNSDEGELLGSNGLIYTFHFSDQEEDFSYLDLKTKVSFSCSSEDKTYENVHIDKVLEDMQDPIIKHIDLQVQEYLSPSRYLHSFRISKIAHALANRFGVSSQKAEIAGLLHDIAKEKSNEENLKLIQSSDLKLTSFELSDHSYLHAAAGSILAEKHFGINDIEILHAILYHNGRPAMQTLEKIIYLADTIDYTYKNGLYSVNEISSQDNLDQAIFMMFTCINRTLAKNGKHTNVITESMMNYMLVHLNDASSSREIAEDTATSITDEMFDRALEISMHRGLPISSIKNVRELGGCKLNDGKRVRHHMLVRSGRLSDLTLEDSKKLKDFGIDTIIDLRTEEEVQEAPDQNVSEFRWIHCPLPSIERSDYHNHLLEKYLLSPIGEEKTYYLSEYLSCIDMKEMYLNVLTKETSIESLRKIFHILLDPSCKGFLFHCTSGKDRTGILSALILLALGASYEEIQEDYYTSALAYFSETEFFAQSLRRQNYSPSYIDEMRYFNGVGMNIPEDVEKIIITQYGSFEQYLRELVDEEMIEQLRDKFIE